MSKFKFLFILMIALGPYAKAESAAGSSAYRREQWMNLLFYRKKGEGFLSKVTTSQFFLAANGRANPEAEWKAEIETFQKVIPFSLKHPQCVFPARYHILQNFAKLAPAVECPQYDSWKRHYGLSYISLFYAAQYMSSPSSVFGHAFLLLGSDHIEEYSRSTLSYAAEIPSDVGIFAYAYKGLGGYFKGSMSLVPYYRQLHIYSNMEDRDLWEYRLQLTPEEMQFLSDFVWELQDQVQMDYYFLTENCATILLWMMKAVRPSIDIKTYTSLYVPPSEVTQIFKRQGLVSQTIFHPSLSRRLNAKWKKMNSSERKTFRFVMDDKKIPGKESDALLLEAVMDHANLERHRHNGQLPEDLKDLENQTLELRSQITATPFQMPESEIPPAPDAQHPPLFTSLAMAWKNGLPYGQWTFRPAIHGFLDKESGYLKNSTVEFFQFTLDYSGEQKLNLQKFLFFEMGNFRSVSFYKKYLSWKGGCEIRQNDFDQNIRRHFFDCEGQIGYATDFETENFLPYMVVKTNVRQGSSRPFGDFDIGPSIGLVYSRERWKSDINVAYLSETSGAPDSALWQANFNFNFRLNENFSALGEYSLWQNPSVSLKADRVTAGVGYYF